MNDLVIQHTNRQQQKRVKRVGNFLHVAAQALLRLRKNTQQQRQHKILEIGSVRRALDEAKIAQKNLVHHHRQHRSFEWEDWEKAPQASLLVQERKFLSS